MTELRTRKEQNAQKPTQNTKQRRGSRGLAPASLKVSEAPASSAPASSHIVDNYYSDASNHKQEEAIEEEIIDSLGLKSPEKHQKSQNIVNQLQQEVTPSTKNCTPDKFLVGSAGGTRQQIRNSMAMKYNNFSIDGESPLKRHPTEDIDQFDDYAFSTVKQKQNHEQEYEMMKFSNPAKEELTLSEDCASQSEQPVDEDSVIVNQIGEGTTQNSLHDGVEIQTEIVYQQKQPQTLTKIDERDQKRCDIEEDDQGGLILLMPTSDSREYLLLEPGLAEQLRQEQQRASALGSRTRPASPRGQISEFKLAANCLQQNLKQKNNSVQLLKEQNQSMSPRHALDGTPARKICETAQQSQELLQTPFLTTQRNSASKRKEHNKTLTPLNRVQQPQQTNKTNRQLKLISCYGSQKQKSKANIILNQPVEDTPPKRKESKKISIALAIDTERNDNFYETVRQDNAEDMTTRDQAS